MSANKAINKASRGNDNGSLWILLCCSQAANTLDFQPGQKKGGSKASLDCSGPAINFDLQFPFMFIFGWRENGTFCDRYWSNHSYGHLVYLSEMKQPGALLALKRDAEEELRICGRLIANLWQNHRAALMKHKIHIMFDWIWKILT